MKGEQLYQRDRPLQRDESLQRDKLQTLQTTIIVVYYHSQRTGEQPFVPITSQILVLTESRLKKKKTEDDCEIETVKRT